MPRNVVSKRPRHLPSSLMSTLSVVSSSAQSIPSTLSARTSVAQVRCFYCPKFLQDDSARRQHITSSPQCHAAERAVLREEIEKRRQAERTCDTEKEGGQGPKAAELGVPGATPSANKRRRVSIEIVPDETETNARASTNQPLCTPSPPRIPTHANSDPGSSELGSPRRDQTPTDDRPDRPRLRRYKSLYLEEYPDALAGSPISKDRQPAPDLDAYMRSCGRMADPKTFEAAEILLTTGLTDAAKDRHLKSSMYQGRTPWGGCDAMLLDVDKLRHGTVFEIHDIDIFDGRGRRMQFMVSRNIVHVLEEILANPDLKEETTYAPIKLWTSPDMKEQVFGDSRASVWWWEEQLKLARQGKRNATVLPLILATDQTVLAIMCGGQKAYPVYVTIANVEKSARRKPSKRAMALLGYLPVEAFEDIENDDERRRLKGELVHRAMAKMLEPLQEASENGVEMWCPDGRKRLVFPRMAAYTVDWPEQNLHSCTSEGSCPVCKSAYVGRGNAEAEVELRDREETLGAIRSYFAQRNAAELKALRLKPIWPWWGDLPDVNLAACITPDLLHQLYQGIFKTHLLRWLKHLVGAKKLDERFETMPQAEGMRHFSKGITGVGQWTGRESKQMMAQIVPVVIGDLGNEMARMVLALVNFMFRAHGSSLTETDLKAMESDLATFHELKGLLVERGVYESEARFDKIPKLHMLRHYTHSVRQMGTPDGFTTEAPERLHIEYAKVPWRASNKVRPLPQMVKYIQRQEAIRIHRSYLDRWLRLDVNEDGDEGQDGVEEDTVEVGGLGDGAVGNDGRTGNRVVPGGHSDQSVEGVAPGAGFDEVAYPNPRQRLAVDPTKRRVPLWGIIKSYGAENILSDIKDFLVRRHGQESHDVLISSHNHVDVWHKLYLHHQLLPFAPFDPPRRDVVRAGAQVLDARGRPEKQPAWDIALFLEKPNRLRPEGDHGVDDGRPEGEKHGILRYRAGRVRTIFTLPGHLIRHYSKPLAYVELFKPFDESVSQFSGMHSTKPDYDSRNRRRTLVIPVADIHLACHLVPKFHKLNPTLSLTRGLDLLPLSNNFWLNHFYNHYFYQLVQHWWRRKPVLLDRLAPLAR